MRFTLPACITGLLLTGVLHGAQICPPDQMKFLPSDNGSSTKAFSPVNEKGVLRIDFKDQSRADNYLHIDCGNIDLTGFLPGGYVEVDAELDKPILRMAGVVTDPASFWPARLIFSGEAKLQAGRHTYRFYLDTLPAFRLAERKDHLYLFIHDLGGESKGDAVLKIHSSRLRPSEPNWETAKNDCYRTQYQWRKFPDLGKFYRGEYGRAVAIDAAEKNPFMREIPLDGWFEKSFIGDITWNYPALTDIRAAQPGSPLPGTPVRVQVPEKPAPDQPGGYYWYKREFQAPVAPGSRVLLRFDDLADSAEIYLNGTRVGSQSSVRRRHDWVLKNGSRQAATWGKPAREVAMFQHFARCGIPFPFDPKALPEDDVMLLPIYSGEYPWLDAFDVSDLIRDGVNTLAVRLYNNPVRGYWIFRYADDRQFRGEAGIFGRVRLLAEAQPAFAEVGEVTAGKVASDGTVRRTVSGKVNAGVTRIALTGPDGLRGEVRPDASGNFSISGDTAAGFGEAGWRLTAFDRENRAVGERDVTFLTTVIELRGRKLFVNGDAFQVRGINGNLGVEFKNDRRTTRREWLRQLTLMRRLGFNSLRLESVQPQHLRDALEYGFMVMPVCAPGSCNTSEIWLGNLEKPDYEFITDSHKEMSAMLRNHPNVLIWNSGNEIHSTGGYNDKVLMDRVLETARTGIRRFDPAKRPVCYANLNMFGTYWCFEAGQDIFGYNSYELPDRFRGSMKKMSEIIRLPIVFTEWGFFDNEPRALAHRRDRVAEWEKFMRDKWAIMLGADGVVGGYLYAYHGELNDDRGRAFLQDLMLPFRVTAEGDSLKFENLEVAPMRRLTLAVTTAHDVPAVETVEELAPGRSMRLPLPADKANAVLEINYETHRGLKHSYRHILR